MHMTVGNTSRWWTLVVTVALGMPSLAQAQVKRAAVAPLPVVRAATWEKKQPTLKSPYRLDVKGLQAPTPVWTRDGLWLTRPAKLFGLATVEKPGIPTYDAATDAWYATAMGVLVRVAPDGSLPKVLDDVAGLDMDVRPQQGLAVSRAPGKPVVLHHFKGAEHTTKELLTGDGYFAPRFSPDGTRLLVTESRAGGGHTWLLDLEGKAEDLGVSQDATWLPDGGILFTRVETDGHAITAATLFTLDLASRTEKKLARTTGPVVTKPAVSPDGKWLAFVDAKSSAVMVAALPGAERK